MCGIGAIARLGGGTWDEQARPVLDRMADLLAHRGPDERELVFDGAVGLAFTRLSLVDPTGGSQPLVSEDGNLMLIVNGEVYNHKELAHTLPPGLVLRTGSDCEVLLYLYREHGLNFLDNVRGMFGLILWDRREGRLVLARDRFGIKPLYFHRDADRLILGSEITSLFADAGTPRAVDWQRTLTTPYLVSAPCFTNGGPTTWFEGIESVPAGTIMSVDLTSGRTTEHRYWTFPGSPVTELEDAEAYIEAYRDLLVSSVQECATADAELGLFLSGGIDSASVAAIAAGRADSLHTFSVLSASTYLNGEASNAHAVAQKLGLPNHQVVFDTGRVPSPDEWKRLLWLVETPLCGPEIYYKHEMHRYAKSVRPQLRGMLLGSASDEFNGGYSVGRAGPAGWPGFVESLRAMGRTGALLRRPELAPWWAYGDQPLLTDDVVSAYTGVNQDDPFPAYFSWEYLKIEQYNCWHEDRTAAGSGIEARVPFLDHRLVELAMSVPPQLRETLFWDKQILRSAMRGLLPEDVLQRPKGYFFHGDGVRHTYRLILRMLAQGGAALVEEALAAPAADRLFDGGAVRATLRRLYVRPDEAQVETLLRVVNLGLISAMLQNAPRPVTSMPVAAVPSAIEISGRPTDAAEIENLVGLRSAAGTHDVPRLAEDVMLLTDPTSRQWFLAVNGEIEFVLSEDETSTLWLLRAVDGERSVTDLAEVLHRPVDDVAAEVADLVDQGLATVTNAANSER